MYNTIFTVSLSVLLALFVGLGLLFGRKYKWYYSLARVGTAIASGIGSFFLSSMLAKHLGDVGYDILIKNLPSKITDYVKDIPSAPDVFGALVTIILSPIFFVALFFIFKAILNCIIKNVCISIEKKKALSSLIKLTIHLCRILYALMISRQLINDLCHRNSLVCYIRFRHYHLSFQIHK